MAAEVVVDILGSCMDSLNSSTLLRLLDHLIEVKWPLQRTEHSSTINGLLRTFFSGRPSWTEKSLILETTLCWLEQHDEPFSTGVGTDFPSLALLEDLCRHHTLDFPIGDILLHKLWFIFLYNSPDPWELFDVFGERITHNGYGLIMRHFTTQLPWPSRPYPCQVRARQDIVRMLRYAVIASYFVCHHGERPDHIKFARQTLQKCLFESFRAAERDNPWRPDYKEALFFLRTRARSNLAFAHLRESDQPRLALNQLCCSASEQCARDKIIGEFGGYRQFLVYVAVGPSEVSLRQIRALLAPEGDVVIPLERLWDFIVYMAARGTLLKRRRRWMAARAWLELAKKHLECMREVHFPNHERPTFTFMSAEIMALDWAQALQLHL
jgi:hypothetical protein